MGEVTGKRFVHTQARRMQPCASNFIALNPERRTNAEFFSERSTTTMWVCVCVWERDREMKGGGKDKEDFLGCDLVGKFEHKRIIDSTEFVWQIERERGSDRDRERERKEREKREREREGTLRSIGCDSWLANNNVFMHAFNVATWKCTRVKIQGISMN